MGYINLLTDFFLENFICGRGGGSARSTKKFTEKLTYFIENGEGLIQSLESLTGKSILSIPGGEGHENLKSFHIPSAFNF